MENEIYFFNNAKFGSVRAFADEKGDPWFVAADVAKVIDVQNIRQNLEALDDDEKGVYNSYTLGGNQNLTTVNESGLYALIIRSRKPEAKAFRKWVTSEVIPSIRKTGSYSVKSSVDTIVYSSDPLERSRALTKLLEEERSKQELITKERDDARDLVRDVVQDNTTYTATEIAKDLGLRSAIELNKWLVNIGFMYKHGKSYLPYAEFSKMGLTSHKLYDTGNGFNVKTVKFTNLGKMWIVEKWKELHKTSKDMLFLLEGDKSN